MNNIPAGIIPILVRNALAKERIATELQKESNRIMEFIIDSNFTVETQSYRTLMGIRDCVQSLAMQLGEDLDYAKAMR